MECLWGVGVECFLWGVGVEHLPWGVGVECLPWGVGHGMECLLWGIGVLSQLECWGNQNLVQLPVSLNLSETCPVWWYRLRLQAQGEQDLKRTVTLSFQ